MFGELMSLAEQRLDVFLGEMDVVCRRFRRENGCCFCASRTRVIYERLSARNASRAIMRSSSVGTTSTATFESSVEMRLLVCARRILVARAVEPDAHALQTLQRQRANHCASLADTAGENHRVESAHGCDVSADVLRTR